METTKLSSSPPRGSVQAEDGAEVGSSRQKACTVRFPSPWAAWVIEELRTTWKRKKGGLEDNEEHREEDRRASGEGGQSQQGEMAGSGHGGQIYPRGGWAWRPWRPSSSGSRLGDHHSGDG